MNATYTPEVIDDGFQAIVAMFVDELGDRITAIEQAEAAGDMPTLRRLSHQLKGAAGGYGFAEMGNLAAVVERRCDEAADATMVGESTQALIAACEAIIADA